MMFIDGFHSRADIYRISRAGSGRTQISDTHIEQQPVFEDIPCRIIRDSKILFSQTVILSDGDTVRDRQTGIIYEVTGGKLVNGLRLPHHRSYTVRKKPQSAAYGQPGGIL